MTFYKQNINITLVNKTKTKNTMSNANTSTKTKNKRASYGFELNFPETFTMRELRNLKGRKIKYITLYMRVKKALKDGEIVISGKKEPAKSRKGRKELVYSLANAKTSSVTVGKVEASV